MARWNVVLFCSCGQTARDDVMQAAGGRQQDGSTERREERGGRREEKGEMRNEKWGMRNEKRETREGVGAEGKRDVVEAKRAWGPGGGPEKSKATGISKVLAANEEQKNEQ